MWLFAALLGPIERKVLRSRQLARGFWKLRNPQGESPLRERFAAASVRCS